MWTWAVKPALFKGLLYQAWVMTEEQWPPSKSISKFQ